ncbi:MAG: phospholipid carrier-dependent glycosyltransferase [Myxococcales bacterium]|nr:phospholipid carrier-dependent glycosyltransferase [Myxococcales bacterium]
MSSELHGPGPADPPAPAAPSPPAEAPVPKASPDAGPAARLVPDRRVLLWLAVAALVTRLLWVLLIHPPGDYVFSDMGMYVKRARDLVNVGVQSGVRDLAWQAYGTHYLLAVPFKIFGPEAPYRAAGVLWGLLGALAVPLTYLVACRVLPTLRLAAIAGVIALLWYPNLSTTGYFLSETPFLAFQLLAVHWLLRVLQEGRMAWPAGLAAACAFMLRPQSSIFFAMVLLLWLVNFRRLPWVRWRQLVGVGLPLVAALLFSLWRYHSHTGRWDGIAENANMNLTAGRCHNIVTQAFKKPADLKKSEKNHNTNDGRRVSLPGFRTLAKVFPHDHPLGLRPAMESETIRFVGYIGDPWLNQKIRQECYRRTGVLGQLRYSVVNLMLQWFIAKQWPDNSKGKEYFLGVSEVFRHGFQIVVLVPSLIGMGVALGRWRRRPAHTLVALVLLGSMITAAIFFGEVRLRTPYDPYAVILALLAGAWCVDLWRRRRARAAAA